MRDVIIESLSRWSESVHSTPVERRKWKNAVEAFETGDNRLVLGLLQLRLYDLYEASANIRLVGEQELPGAALLHTMINWIKNNAPTRKCPGLFRFKSQKCLLCNGIKSGHQSNGRPDSQMLVKMAKDGAHNQHEFEYVSPRTRAVKPRHGYIRAV